MNKYLRLMRFDKPAGIALLWAPTAWALWLANQGHPSVWVLIYFFLGTVCMRAAGCVINDLADRHIDKHVERTRLRPITSGEITITDALIVLIVLLLSAGWIAVHLPILCWYEACIGLLITIIYPFAKRFFHAPQLLLGVAFSWGIPMAYAASGQGPDQVMYLLMILNFFWIVAYDTMYAIIDLPDDLRIGVRSTAILFGAQLQPILISLLCLTHSLWLVVAYMSPVSIWFMLAWCVGLSLFIYIGRLLTMQTPQAAFRAFLWNAVYGCVMWLGLMA